MYCSGPGSDTHDHWCVLMSHAHLVLEPLLEQVVFEPHVVRLRATPQRPRSGHSRSQRPTRAQQLARRARSHGSVDHASTQAHHEAQSVRLDAAAPVEPRPGLLVSVRTSKRIFVTSTRPAPASTASRAATVPAGGRWAVLEHPRNRIPHGSADTRHRGCYKPTAVDALVNDSDCTDSLPSYATAGGLEARSPL